MKNKIEEIITNSDLLKYVDMEIHITPNDNKDGKDPQLDKGIEIIKNELKNKKSVLKPDFKNKPNLKLPS